jgi:hypothetical protein
MPHEHKSNLTIIEEEAQEQNLVMRKNKKIERVGIDDLYNCNFKKFTYNCWVKSYTIHGIPRKEGFIKPQETTI